MSRLLELRDLLQGDQPVFGRVVTVDGDLVQVATAAGVVEAEGDGGLKTGDTVTVQNGRVIKKRLDSPAPVHFV